MLCINGIECYEKNGCRIPQAGSRSAGLGFTDASKSAEYVRWNTVWQYLGEIRFSQEVAKDTFIQSVF